MGNVPKPLLVLVTLILLLCGLAGFGIGFLPTVRHGVALDDEEVASGAISSLGAVEDAQPLTEPAPPPPKPKAAPASSEAPASDEAPAPLVKAGPPAVPPVEAAPAVPAPPQPIAPQPKAPAPTDLPPT